MDGTIVVSHETPSDTVIYRTDPGFLQPGDVLRSEIEGLGHLRNRCVAQLRESKADEETEIWMRRLRDEAFVEYRL